MVYKKSLVWGMRASLSAFVVALAVFALSYTPTIVEAARGERCEGDVKIEGSSGTVVAPPGMAIDFICIKAGREVFTFGFLEEDPTGCFNIDWGREPSGCVKAVTIGGGGTSRYCKEISHFSVTFKVKGICS